MQLLGLGTTPVAVHGGSVTGGAGGDHVADAASIPGNGSFGGLGLLANFDATLLLAGCAVTGGHGGDGTKGPGDFASSTYAGGDGVSISSQSELRLLEAELAGGEPGVDGLGQPGFPGIALQADPTAIVELYPGAYRAVSFGAPAPEGGALDLAIDGVPGDLVGLYVSAVPGMFPGPQGTLHLGPPLLGPFLLGPVDASGALAISFAVPDLGFGPDDAVTFYAQALVKPLAGATLLSSPTTAVLIDGGL